MVRSVFNLFTFTSMLPTKYQKRYYTFSITPPNYHPNTEKETQILIFQDENNPTSSLPPTSEHPNST